MREKDSLEKKSMEKRIFPRLHADQYQKLLVIATKRGQNLSELTRTLYNEVIDKEFPSNQKPVAEFIATDWL
jgi:hypothetical protein